MNKYKVGKPNVDPGSLAINLEGEVNVILSELPSTPSARELSETVGNVIEMLNRVEALYIAGYVLTSKTGEVLDFTDAGLMR